MGKMIVVKRDERLGSKGGDENETQVEGGLDILWMVPPREG